MDYSPWSEGEIWPFLKVAISPKLDKPRPPKLVCMPLTSIPTCMNFLGRFRSIKLFDDHGHSPWSEGEIWPFLKVAISPKLRRSRPPKLVYMHLTINPYLHEFFGWFPINWIFWWPWTIVHGQKGKFGRFWKLQYLWNWRDHAHQNWCTCTWHQFLLAWKFWADSDWLDFLMTITMDYIE